MMMNDPDTTRPPSPSAQPASENLSPLSSPTMRPALGPLAYNATLNTQLSSAQLTQPNIDKDYNRWAVTGTENWI